MKIQQMLISKKSAFFVLFVTLLILLIPLVAMQLTTEVNWQLNDFVVAAVILSFFGYVYKVLTQSAEHLPRKLAIGAMVIVAFAVVWGSLI